MSRKAERRGLLASITNLEGNLKLELWLNDAFDYNSKRSDYENGILFTLCLTFPDRRSTIEENMKATMTAFEIENMIHGIENVLAHMKYQESCIYTFNSSESFFELKLEIISEDNVIETELWINTGSQTNGVIYGYDEGVRFITNENELNNFCRDFKRNYLEIKSLYCHSD